LKIFLEKKPKKTNGSHVELKQNGVNGDCSKIHDGEKKKMTKNYNMEKQNMK